MERREISSSLRVGRSGNGLGRRLLELTIPAAFALNTVFPIGNLDIWFHLKTGQLIHETWKIPTSDPFSFTAFGNPWINHEWLFGYGAYLVYAATGLTGLILLKAAVAGLVLWLVQRTVRRYRPSALLEVEVLVLAAIAVFPRVYVRPHMLTFLFVAYLVWRLDGFRRGRSRPLWEMPVLFALWSNVHGGVVFGLGVLGLTALGDAMDSLGRRRGGRRRAGLGRGRPGHLALVTVLSALATLANPFTYRLHLFIAEHLFLGDVVQIAEHLSVFGLGFTFYWVVAAVSAFALYLLWPRRRWADFLLVLSFGLFSMKSHRTTPVFLIVAAPVIVKALRGPRPSADRPALSLAAYGTAVAAFLALALGGRFFPGYYQRIGVPPVGLGLYEARYPVGAAGFVERHRLPGPMYNEYDFGGYLIWRWYPERKVFQDGRTLVYDKEFFRSVYGAETPSEWEKLMEEYGVRLALVSSQVEVNFTRRFTSERWALLYWDEVAAVMVRRLPALEEVVDRLGYRLLRPFLTGPEVITMVEQGRARELEEELRRHLASSPESPRGRALKGWKLLAEGEPAEALKEFREALKLDGFLYQAHWGAARALEALGRKEAARRHWRRVLQIEAKGRGSVEARRASRP